MLIRTPLTFLSAIRMRKAFLICSALAPPPTSRKLAGSPPASLMMSIVAIARPAPLMMQPMLPARAISIHSSPDAAVRTVAGGDALLFERQDLALFRRLGADVQKHRPVGAQHPRRGADPRVLEKHNLKVSYNGRLVDAEDPAARGERTDQAAEDAFWG